MGRPIEMTQHAEDQRIARALAGCRILRVQRRHIGGPLARRFGRSSERRRQRIQCRADVAEHRDVAGKIEPELAGRGRDLDDLQFARQRREAVIGEGVDLLADQQHRVVAAERLVDFPGGRRKLTAEVRMQGIDRALHVEWRGVDVRGERGRDAAHSVDAMRGADGIVGDDGELARWNGLQGARDTSPIARGTASSMIRVFLNVVCSVRSSMKFIGNRQKDRPGRLEPRLQVAALQRHGEIVGAGHLVRVFGGGLGKLGVRRAEDRIVNEKARILLPVDHEQRHAGHQRIAHVEHAVGQARIGVQADDGRLAGDERVAGGDADRAGFVQRQDVGGLRCRYGCQEGRLRRPRIAEHERNFVRLKKVLDEFAACPTCHDPSHVTFIAWFVIRFLVRWRKCITRWNMAQLSFRPLWPGWRALAARGDLLPVDRA